MAEAGYLSMAAVRRATGLTERQIRYYDEKGLVVPDRTPGGHRLYTREHVERLLVVKGLLGSGMTVEEVRQQLESAGAPSARAAGHEPDARLPYDERGLEDVKIYFGSLRRSRHEGR
jgi:DNA-binding transcriptional MerR regulator